MPKRSRRRTVGSMDRDTTLMAFDPRERVLHTIRGATSDPGARLGAWLSLVRGEYSITLYEGVYAFHARAPRDFDRLTCTEASVARVAAHELTGKSIACTLGLARSTVSMTLGSAAAKLGLASSTDLVRLVRALVTEDAALDPSGLSEAERDVLAHLIVGKSNSEIAQLRGRSIRTVANQVAAILRKTKNPSRHALRVKAS